MMRHSLSQSLTQNQRRAFSFAEVLVSTILVGLILVAALQAAGAAVRAFSKTANSQKAVLLAEELLAEIIQQDYIEPTDSPLFGSEGLEASASTGPRTLWDDVDDYNSWDSSPPQEKSGAILPNLTGWRRWVEVTHIDPNNLSTPIADSDDRGVKRVTVNVSCNGATLASLVSYQTEAWVAMIPDPGNILTEGAAPPVNQAPTAVAAGSPTSGAGTLDVTFDATGSFDPEAQDLTYQWNFGDGDSGTGVSAVHRYTNSGPTTEIYTATLTATDVYGAKDQDTISITVFAAP